MLPAASSYVELARRFRWLVPDRYNIGIDVCDRHVLAGRGDHTALLCVREDGSRECHTFADLMDASNRLANALVGLGLRRGDRVGILLSQSVETALTHLAVYKTGAIALPLFTLFGEDGLAYRLENSGARAVVTDRDNLPKVMAIRSRVPDLAITLVVGGGSGGIDFWETLGRASPRFAAVDTRAEDPALVIYTSGTTGNPKGALHAHRVLLGHLPGVELPHEFFPKPGDLFWTPADWAWIGGLIDVLLPSLHHGVPVLAHRAPKFDPEAAFRLMARHQVRNVFMPPTALKLLRQVERPQDRHGVRLRSLASGGETLGAELLEWGRETFGLTINEFYGQTECNLVVGNCAGLMEVRPGSMGRAIPGHEVAIVDDAGNPLPAGQTGSIAVRRGDPVMLLGYWGHPAATADKYASGWLLTGDLGKADADGYLWFVGRADDVITSAGYRIGPAEIEDCLMGHPAVAMAAAVGVPDPLRTEIVKAFIVLKPGHHGDAGLAAAIQSFVKTKLAAHEYPRLVEFVDSLPMTATGKIRRKVLRERGRA